MTRREEIARLLAKQRGHRDLEADIWINDEQRNIPVWRFYLADADELLALDAGGVVAPREPSEAMLRAWYEAGHKPSDSPAGGFTRWATWEEASELSDFVDNMRRCYRAMIIASGEGEEGLGSLRATPCAPGDAQSQGAGSNGEGGQP